MNRKLPNVFVNKQDRKIENNKETYYSKEEDMFSLNQDNKSSELVNNLMVKKKINDIFTSPSFVYKVRVNIRTVEEDRNVVLIARTMDTLLTMDNEVIPIKDIQQIKEI